MEMAHSSTNPFLRKSRLHLHLLILLLILPLLSASVNDFLIPVSLRAGVSSFEPGGTKAVPTDDR